MGQGQQKPTINPNTAPTVNNQNTQNGNTNNSNTMNSSGSQANMNQKLTYIRQALRNCSNMGYLNKDGFNQVLAVLQNLKFKRIRDTPIADRLFKLLDQQNTGKVSQQEFSKVFNEIMGDRNAAIMYSFKVYDSDRDNRISRKQFLQIIQDSWRAAYRILAEKCDGAQYGKVSLRDLQSWAASKVQILNQHSSKLFNKLDSQGQGYIQFQVFKQFVTSSGYNDITASINGDKVVIPIHLTNLIN